MSTIFEHPESIEETLSLLSQHGDEAKILAGGTAMVLLLNQGFISPSALISLDRLKGVDSIRLDDDGLHIGAMATLREIENNEIVLKHYPAFAHACHEVGNVRIRNQATLGGNLAEADYASDPPAMLSVLNASIKIEKVGASRIVPIADFLLGFYTTVLEPEEMITEISLPPIMPGTRMSYHKFKTRSSEDRPCVGTAVFALMNDKVCEDLRVAIGAATEIPLRLPELEASAKNQVLNDTLIKDIAQGYADAANTLDDLRGSDWYRKQMIKVHIHRALEEIRDDRRW